MKKSRFTETQITGALKAYEAGKDVQQICREMKINRATFYNWKKSIRAWMPSCCGSLKRFNEKMRS